MNKEAAVNLVKETLENRYSSARFLVLSKNLFQFLDTKPFVYRGNYIPDAFKPHIKILERIGKYEDQAGNKIDVLAVCLEKPSALERARTMQRNFISWYLNGSRGDIAKDAALVAFFSEDLDDWRLSLVKMDYHLAKSSSGKVRAVTELTPARRFSFLVGKNENTHTAQRQLLPILTNEEHPPSLADFEEAFSVEVVTKDFFENYKTLFLNTNEALEKVVAKDSKVRLDFDEKNIDTVDFSKKLLGQIVFLYFLQKKGWFGVGRNKDWGTGPKDFLRRLFERVITDYDNFFNNILEPLFYEALAIERPNDYYSRFDSKIPFLNGGLFDPINNYDWVHTDILISNTLFSNDRKTKEGDIGTGILDVFDRYNFTVKEDEPLEKEVAVDPEMLGKVFENLLEVKDRKSIGTYYTPREIVHYMCQESLINYLTTETDGKVIRDDIETLIRLGETVVEHDSRVIARGEETDTYQFKLPQSIRKHASLIDEKLEKIKACDPAVGSGAFLVGLMTEVIRARNTLSIYLTQNNRSVYAFKRHAIQSCLYGVDIDPSAVEIAKLRLWLSLIVDEEDIKQIKPLPNLDYKIMQGNSLLEEYEGIKLFDEDIVLASPLDNTEQIEKTKQRLFELQREYFKLHSAGELKGSKKQQLDVEIKRQNDYLNKLTKTKKVKPENGGLFDLLSQAKQKGDKLKNLHQEFFEASNKNRKDEIKKQIESLEWDLIETTLREQNKLSLLPEIERFKKANIKPFFLWKLNFSEVFEINSGFDVVIANPPYINAISMKKAFSNTLRKQLKEQFASAKGAYDIYLLFFEKGFSLLKFGGYLTFITPNKYLSASYAEAYRSYVVNNHQLLKIVDLSRIRVFEEAATYPVISLFEKGKKNKSKHISTIKPINDEVSDFLNSEFSTFRNNSIYLSFLPGNLWGFLLTENFNLALKVYKQSVPLERVTQVSASSTASESDLFSKLISETKSSSKKKLINTGTIDSYTSLWGAKELLHKGNKYLRPFLDINDRNVSNRRRNLYNSPKIIIAKIGLKTEAFLDNNGDYASLNTNCIYSPGENLKLQYIIGVVNSKLFNFVYKQYFGALRMGGGYFQYQSPQLRVMPIKTISDKDQKPLIKVVDKILTITNTKDYLVDTSKQAKVRDYEKQIDKLVYKLYDLTKGEIEIVEKSTRNS